MLSKVLMKRTLSKALLFVVSSLLFVFPCFCQQKEEQKVITWEDKLFEKSVEYGTFACKSSDKTFVHDFFKSNPLNRILNVCHNNCAVLTEFPERPLPPFDQKIKGTGYIVVHVLVNQKGEPIFARALNGHIIMRSLVQTRACEAKFRVSDSYKQRVFSVCFMNKCEAAQPVE